MFFNVRLSWNNPRLILKNSCSWTKRLLLTWDSTETKTFIHFLDVCYEKSPLTASKNNRSSKISKRQCRTPAPANEGKWYRSGIFCSYVSIVKWIMHYSKWHEYVMVTAFKQEVGDDLTRLGSEPHPRNECPANI